MVTIFGLFALQAIFMACLGLWAMAMFSGMVRKKEMGVRKTLGASNISLLYSLSHEFVSLTIYATIIGIPIAYFIMNEWISSYAFRTDIKWRFFLLQVLIIATISMLTISYQTIKTAYSNVTSSLMHE